MRHVQFLLVMGVLALAISCVDDGSFGSDLDRDSLSALEGDDAAFIDGDISVADVSISSNLYSYRKTEEYRETLRQVLASSPKGHADQSAVPDFPAELDGLQSGRAGAPRVIDRRAWAEQRSLENQIGDIEETARSQKAFYQRAVLRAKAQGVDIKKHPQLKLLAIKAGMDLKSLEKDNVDENDPPVPGGVGYGTFYKSNSFLWTTDTLLAENLIVPRTPGGDVTNYLYNTSTNRSNLGVEAFISYYAQNDAHFKVYDWAKPEAERWQIDLSYSDITPYLVNGRSDDGKWRQLISLYNYTNKTSTNNWYNAVWLWNYIKDRWDLIYVYYYATANETDNTYQPGEHYGSWGPIFETFQDHDGSNKPIGHHTTFLYQDGVSSWLTSDNSDLIIGDADLNPPIFVTPYSGWAVGTSINETSTTMVEAESMSHYIGYASGEGWRADPEGGAGWVAWGSSTLFGTGYSGQRFVVQMDAKVSSTASTSSVLFYGLYDAISGSYVDYRWISPGEFNAAENYQPFRFEVVLSGNALLFPLAYYYGGVSATIDRFSLALD